jgi:hypothetical protein
MMTWSWDAGTHDPDTSSYGDINSGTTNYLEHVNVDAGFSIIKYDGDISGGNQSSSSGYYYDRVAHSLGKRPELIIIKNRDLEADEGDGPYDLGLTDERWAVWHSYLDGSDGYELDISLDNDPQDEQHFPLGTTYMGDPVEDDHTSTYFIIANDGDGMSGGFERVNGGYDSALMYSPFDTSYRFVAYVAVSVPGYSKIEHYRANGDTDGNFIYCGFRPAFLMIKGLLDNRRWWIYDTVRDTMNPATTVLSVDDDVTESDAAGSEGHTFDVRDIDILSNGFKIRSDNAQINDTSEDHIFWAIAESPLKFANSR